VRTQLSLLVLFIVVCSLAGALPGATAADVAPPTSNAGPNQTVNEDAVVVFNGSGSTDDVGIVNYTWALPAGLGAPRPVANFSTPGYFAALFDPVRPLLYLLEPANVTVVNLTTSVVDRTFPLDHPATSRLSFGIAPGGTYLAVGIPIGERGYYYFGPYQSYVATFDLVAQQKIGEFFVDEDVAQTLATTDGHVIIAGGSGQWSSLRMLSATNGTELPQRGTIWQYSSIALHPSETRLYSVDDAGLSPPGVHRFDFSPATGFTGEFYWPYHGTYPGTPLWVSEGLILTGDGYLLASRDNASDDMRSVGRLPLQLSLAALDPSLSLIAAASGGYLAFYEMTNLALVGSRQLANVLALRISGADILVDIGGDVVAIGAPITFRYGVSVIFVFPEPGDYSATLTVWDAAGNHASDTANITVRDITPPVANAGLDRSVVQGSSVDLNASGSTDNVGILQFSWSFVDAGSQTLDGVVVSYVFAHVGTFLITLTTIDAASNSDTDTVAITVARDTIPPLVSAGPDRVVYRGALVTFDGSRSHDNLEIASYTWTFTDGASQTLRGAQPSYRFVNLGTFVVTLTVLDTESNAGTDTLTITVQELTLVEYHRPIGLRLGIPSGWYVTFDAGIENLSSIDLMAIDPSGASIRVTSRSYRVEQTDSFLLAAAGSALADLHYQYGSVTVVREPTIVETAGARAAVFEVNLTGFHSRLVWAVFANAGYGQLIYVIGSADSASGESYIAVFDAVIQSARLVSPPEPPSMIVILVAFLGLTLGALLGSVLWLTYRGRRRLRTESATVPPSVAAPVAPAIAPPAMSPVRPRFCVSCGLPLEATARFCGRCGFRIG